MILVSAGIRETYPMDNRTDREKKVEAAMDSLRKSQSADEQRYFLDVLRELNLTAEEEKEVREILKKGRYKP